MQEMQRLAPQINVLNEKYTAGQTASAAGVDENSIRRTRSTHWQYCLPLLMQLPVFISLFYMLRTDLKKHYLRQGASNSTTSPTTRAGESLSKFIEHVNCETVAPHSAKFLSFPTSQTGATGAALIVLIRPVRGLQLASTLIATGYRGPQPAAPDAAAAVVFVVILYRYPAGLLVYWITTNMWTIGQQYVIRRIMPPPPKGRGSAGGRATVSRERRYAPRSPGSRPERPAQAEPQASSAPARSPAATPPRPPRKKKKRSGRRR